MLGRTKRSPTAPLPAGDVQQGAVRSRVGDEPAKVYRAGESFFEEPGAHHPISENASDSEAARLLAVFIVEAGDKPLAVPDPAAATTPSFQVGRRGNRRQKEQSMAPEFPDSDAARATMMAWRVHAFGPPTVMSFESVPRPDPGEGEVLVRVHAAGVGPWDGWIRAGRSVLPQPLPLTLGSDLSGVVEAVGPGITGFAAGDEVFGLTNSRFVGAYAEYAVASAAMLAGKPRSLTHVQTASVPVIAATAWQGLFEQARLQSGQTVLIHGAAGNVGAYAVQLARRAGFHTIATAGADDLAYVRSLGAEQVVDYRAQRFEDEMCGVDAVLDLVGGETQTRSFKVLRRGGRLVSAVSQPDQARAEQHGVRAEFFLVRVTNEHLSPLAALLEGGELTTRVGAVLPLARAREAHLMLEGEQAAPKGKIVLEVLPD